MKVVFILGSGHCGSTLLDLLLDCHSQIVGVGELQHLARNPVCACGRNVVDCPFWYAAATKIKYDLQVHRKKIDFLLNRPCFWQRRGLDWRRLDSENDFIGVYQSLFEHILQQSGKEVIVLSSKSVPLFELLQKSEVIEPVVIHLVRDGRAVVWSYMKKYNSTLPFIWKWIAENIKVEILKLRYKQIKFLTINYQQLTRDPEGTLKAILAEMSLPWQSEILNFRDFPHHQVGGNRMKLRKDSTIKEDLEWKSKMPWQYKILTNFLLGWLNWYYVKKNK